MITRIPGENTSWLSDGSLVAMGLDMLPPRDPNDDDDEDEEKEDDDDDDDDDEQEDAPAVIREPDE